MVAKGKQPLRTLWRGLTTTAAGVAGAWLADRLGIPAAMILGPMVAVALYRLGGGKTEPWQEPLGGLGRLLIGTVIGSTFGVDVIGPLKTAAAPMVVVVSVILGVSFALGWRLHRATHLKISTAMLASVPGGLPTMVALASDTDCDTTVVAAVHVARVTTVVLLIPALLPLLVTKVGIPTIESAAAVPAGCWATVGTLAIGLSSGLVAMRLKVPSGSLMIPILAVGAVNLLGAEFGPLDIEYRKLAMLLIGVSVGAQVSRNSLRQMKAVAVPAILNIATIIFVGLLLGWALSVTTELDLPTALLSCAPGGASTLAALACDLGGDIRIVAALHFIRQIALLLFMPPILNYFNRRGVARHSHGAPDSSRNR